MRQRAALVAAHDDIEDGFFRHAENIADRLRLLVAGCRDIARRFNHPPERRLFIDNLHIGARIDHRGHALGQLNQIIAPADALQRAASGQLVIHRNHINGHALRIERMHRVKDFAVSGLIEIICRQKLKRQAQGLPVLHHAAKYAFFRVGVIGRHAHNCLVHVVLPFYAKYRGYCSAFSPSRLSPLRAAAKALRKPATVPRFD